MGDCDGPARRHCWPSWRSAPATGCAASSRTARASTPRHRPAGWMLAHDLPVAARYVNWIGRTVRQVREEGALQRALAARVPRDAGRAARRRAGAARASCVAFVDARAARRPAGADAAGADAARLAARQPRRMRSACRSPGCSLLPFADRAAAAASSWLLRRRETQRPRDLPAARRADALRALQQLEDHDVTNQFTAIGAGQAGAVPALAGDAAAGAASTTPAATSITRGHLARVQTIHFARWVFLDDKRARALRQQLRRQPSRATWTTSSTRSAWGLNLVFSNGVGWPRTDWLIKGGARREQRFKHYQRRHQLPTAGLVQGLPRPDRWPTWSATSASARAWSARRMSDAQALAWLRLL